MTCTGPTGTLIGEAWLLIDQRDPTALLVVITASSVERTELETARYYLGSNRTVIPLLDPPGDLMNHQGPIWVSINLQDGQPMSKLPAALSRGKLIQEVIDFPRVRLMRVDFHQSSTPEG